MKAYEEIETIHATGHPEGVDSYPEHHALWHLDVIDIFERPFSYDSDVWDAAEDGKPVTVALIDTPVAWDHPCLQGAIDRGRMVDFSTNEKGAFPVPDDDLDPWEKANRATLANNHEFNKIADDQTRAAVRTGFSAHGTAMAGLIGARPGTVDLHIKARFGRALDAPTPAKIQETELPYAGVNPFCWIVPISTTSDPDPMLLKRSFDYAIAIKADVIVFATSLVPPGAVPKPDPELSIKQDLLISSNERDARSELEKSIIEASENAWVVCAAGNSGQDEPAYPASLSTNHKQIVAVGALTSNRDRAPYSPIGDVWAPSGDEEGYDSQEFRRDPFQYRPEGRPARPGNASEREISVLDIITTDVPGPFGYNPSTPQVSPSRDGVHLDIGSLFCRFSGTSAASAIAGGLIALALQTKGSATVNFTPNKEFLKITDL